MAVRNDFAPGEVLAAADLNDSLDAKLNLAGGKILQIVRATDATNRSTTSNSFVDASISVTITPQKSDSAILIFWTALNQNTSNQFTALRITDSSNNAISGAENAQMGPSDFNVVTLIAYSTPATTSATTYKGRFASTEGSTVFLLNSTTTGQMYAIEVSA
jgi:hypothetical protein